MNGPTQSAPSGIHRRAKTPHKRLPPDRRKGEQRARESVAADTPSNDEKSRTAWFSTGHGEMSGWGLSLLFHAALLAILALFTISLELQSQLPEILAVFSEREQTPQALDLEQLSQEIELSADDALPPSLEEERATTEFQMSNRLELEQIGSSFESAQPDDLLEQIIPISTGHLTGRGAVSRARLVASEGGTPESEAAVALGLQWLANHQNKNGSWSFNHRTGRCRGRCSHPGRLGHCTTGATGLALLCFLGAGHTEQHGEYRAVVRRGVDFLVKEVKKSKRNLGSLMGTVRDNEGMYAHGIATLALCEAYNMGRNPKLRKPVQQAVDFVVRAQHVAGGWRYRPRVQPGDTSVVGWQVMALYSGKIAELKIPQQTLDGAWAFLDSVQSDGGVGYGYRSPGATPTRSAVGLLCRMYLGQSRGWDTNNAAVQEGSARFAALGPSRSDMYYNYYATQFMYQVGGENWQKWNEVMRDSLVATQDKQGHAAGSWPPNCRYGAAPGGRLYMTTMCILTLEVYYRHLPIYARSGPSEDDPAADQK